jgi:hypothetical protein
MNSAPPEIREENEFSADDTRFFFTCLGLCSGQRAFGDSNVGSPLI